MRTIKQWLNDRRLRKERQQLAHAVALVWAQTRCSANRSASYFAKEVFTVYSTVKYGPWSAGDKP